MQLRILKLSKISLEKLYMKRLLLGAMFLIGVFAYSNAQQLHAERANAEIRNDVGTVTTDGENVPTELKQGFPIFVPNAFTPNNDGINDFFYIPSDNLSDFRFNVFDRWGNEVFATQNQRFRWDGTVDSRKVPEGVYVYVLEARTNEGQHVKRSGTISIMR